MRWAALRVAGWLVVVLAAGCGGSSADNKSVPAEDGGAATADDSSSGGGLDAGSSGGGDATVSAGTDAGLEGGADSGLSRGDDSAAGGDAEGGSDAGASTTTDSGASDGGDGGADSGHTTGDGSGTDAGPDGGSDGGVDAGAACHHHGDCVSGLCDLSGTAASGQCVPTGEVVYVDASNDPGTSSCSEIGKDGSQAHPVCRIATALTVVSVTSKTYVHLAGSDNPYDPLELTSTASTLTFVGPGKSATTPAVIQAAANASAIKIDPPGSASVHAVFSGLAVRGNGNAAVLSCNSSGASVPTVTIIDSAFSGGASSEVLIDACAATINTSTFSGGSVGLSFAAGSTYSVQNCFVFGNATGISFTGGSGSFNFNTVAYNSAKGIDCSANATLQDSIVFGNGKSAGSQLSGTHCTLGNLVTGADSYTGALQRVPALVSNTNPHLDTTAGSALTANQACCIDQVATSSASFLPAIDIDDESRPKGTAWDIGADEAL